MSESLLSPPQTQKPEQTPANPEALAADFKFAGQTVLRISTDPSFHTMLGESHLTPDDMDQASYWETFRDFTYASVARMRERTGDDAKLDALELLAAAPAFFYRQIEMDQNPHHPEADTALQSMHVFGETVKAFVTKHPDTPYKLITSELLSMANRSLDSQKVRNVKQVATHLLHSELRGIRSELFAGQMLERSGYRFRPSTPREDIYGHFDYTEEDGPQPMKLDIKASLTEISQQDPTHAFSIVGDRVVIFSLAQDQDFAGKFFAPDDIVATKAEIFTEQLRMAQEKLAA